MRDGTVGSVKTRSAQRRVADRLFACEQRESGENA